MLGGGGGSPPTLKGAWGQSINLYSIIVVFNDLDCVVLKSLEYFDIRDIVTKISWYTQIPRLKLKHISCCHCNMVSV